MESLKPLSPLRWPILILACLMLVGSYYSFDIPAAIKTQIDDYMGDPSDYETLFSLFYTLYSAPNCILPFFGGYFVDIWGVRACLLIFTCLICTGQVIFSLGLSLKSWPVLMLGRLVFGFGGESLIVANSALLADWFKGKELAFAFGVNLAIARLGSVVNNLVSPALVKSEGVVFAAWFGSIICAASVFCVVVTIPIDRAMDLKIKLLQNTSGLLDLDEDDILVAEESGRGKISDKAKVSLVSPAASPSSGAFPNSSASSSSSSSSSASSSFSSTSSFSQRETLMSINTMSSPPSKDHTSSSHAYAKLEAGSGSGSGSTGRKGAGAEDSTIHNATMSPLAGADATQARDSSIHSIHEALVREQASTRVNSGDETATSAVVVENVKILDCLSFSRIFFLLLILCVVVYGCVLPFNNVASTLLLERDYFIVPPSPCTLQNVTACQSDSNPTVGCPSGPWYQPPLPENVYVPGIGYFSGKLSENDIDCTNTLWSGSGNCGYEYCKGLNAGEAQASLIMSIPYIISGVLSPILGIVIDNFGCRAILATAAPGFLIIVHFLLGFTKVNPVGPLVGQGLAYTGFAAVLWPAVPLVVEEKYTGLAFGVMTSMSNLGTAVLPLIVAQIYLAADSTYIPYVELLFGCLGIVGFLVGLLTNYEDYFYHNSILNKVDTSLNGVVMPSSLVSDDSTSNDAAVLKERLLPGVTSSSSSHAHAHDYDNNQGNNKRQISTDREANRSRSRSGGSFTSYGEIFLGGAFDKKSQAH